jgi:predicted ribosomally synthesized peptide with SipW-like signal peptide
MSPDRSGSRHASGVSRRRLLAGLGGVGAVGMASGAGTFAYLSDRETLASNEIGAGTLELQLLIGDQPIEGPVTLDVSGIDRGASGDNTVNLRIRTNPARVWLATDCPKHGDDLAEALEVRLTVDSRSVSGSWQPFASFRRSFFDGLRLDDGCLPPDVDVPVTLHWRLPADVDDSLEGLRTEFTFELYAEQCRHVSEDEAATSNPFAGRVCDGPDEPEECLSCEEFGKADDIDGSLEIDDVIDLVELPSDVGPHSIVITDAEHKDDGEAVGVAFDLVDGDGNPGPDICRVEVKGGPNTKPYDIEPPRSVIGEILQAPEAPGSSTAGLAGISNVVIFVCADGEPAAPDEKHKEKNPGKPDKEKSQ